MLAGIALLSTSTALLGYLLVRGRTAGAAEQKSSMLGSTALESLTEPGAPSLTAESPLARWEPKVIVTYQTDVETDVESEE